RQTDGPMKLFLDDDSIEKRLVQLLRKAGHDVQIPSDVSLAGRSDAVHLRHAAKVGRVTLTRNHGDFEELHDLIRETAGHHPGILVNCKENDTRRDLNVPGIVRAIARLEASGAPVADELHILNHWR